MELRNEQLQIVPHNETCAVFAYKELNRDCTCGADLKNEINRLKQQITKLRLEKEEILFQQSLTQVRRSAVLKIKGTND